MRKLGIVAIVIVLIFGIIAVGSVIYYGIETITAIQDAKALTLDWAMQNLEQANREKRYNEIVQDFEIIGEIQQQVAFENQQAEINATQEQQEQVQQFRQGQEQQPQKHITAEQFQQQFDALNKTMGLS